MKYIFEEVTGENIYCLFSEKEKGNTTYGITVKNNTDKTVIRDITTIYSKACDIYETLIRNTVSPVHTENVISDIIS